MWQYAVSSSWCAALWKCSTGGWEDCCLRGGRSVCRCRIYYYITFWPIRILVILFRLVIPESSGDPEGVNSLRELFYTSTNVNNSRYYYYYFHPRVDPESGTAGIFIHTAVNIRSVTPDQSLMRMRVGSRNSVSRLPFLRVKFFGSPSEVTLTPSPKSRF